MEVLLKVANTAAPGTPGRRMYVRIQTHDKLRVCPDVCVRALNGKWDVWTHQRSGLVVLLRLVRTVGDMSVRTDHVMKGYLCYNITIPI
jgi:hypothetical protein